MAAGLAAIALIAIGLVLATTASRDGRSPAPPRPDGAPRLAVLSPGIAVMLRDLGMAEAVVGRHAFDLVLPAEVPSCGDQNGLDYEALISVRPTHVLLQQDARGSPDRLRALAARFSWDVRVYPLLRLDDIALAIADLRGIGGAPISSAADDLERRWAASIRRREEPLGNAGRVLLLAAVNPFSALGPGSWHHQILERLGGTPAITEGAPYISMDAEDVLALAPDAIVLILPRAPDAPAAPEPSLDALKELLGRVGRLDIPAVRHGRVALIDDPLAHTPSTAMIGLADRLADILGRWSR